MDTLHWRSSARSDVGCVRETNEDACLDNGNVGLWAVADGLGGHPAGDLASRSIVAALADVPAPGSLNRMVGAVAERLSAVNRQLQEEAGRRLCRAIGSTVAVLLAWRRQCACLWAGDSRIYRLRTGALEQLTHDHSAVQAMVDCGELRSEDAASHPTANLITRAVGTDDELEIDIAHYDLAAGDRLLLCSDGLYREVADAELAVRLAGEDVDATSRDLLQLALARGARDNVTLIVVQVM